MKNLFSPINLLCMALSFPCLSFAANPMNTLEKDQKPPSRPAFFEFDLDNNGTILLEEFQQHAPPHGTSEEIFKAIDTDGDGMITEEEFNNHKPPRYRRKSNSKQPFNRLK